MRTYASFYRSGNENMQSSDILKLLLKTQKEQSAMQKTINKCLPLESSQLNITPHQVVLEFK